MRIRSLILVSTFLFCSCASTVRVLKPEGETAKLTLRDFSKHQVEFLAISDSTVYVKERNRICAASLSDVNNIYISGYEINPGLKILSAIPPLCLEGIVMMVAFDVDQVGWGAISGLVMAVTFYAYVAGNPKVSFSPPLEEHELEELRLYSRFPQGLSDEQWKILLQQFNQEDFQSLSTW